MQEKRNIKIIQNAVIIQFQSFHLNVQIISITIVFISKISIKPISFKYHISFIIK